MACVSEAGQAVALSNKVNTVPLPARVRVSRPPLPLAPALRTAVQKLCPGAPLDRLTAVALAIAGGSVIGAHLSWNGDQMQAVEPGWRGRGIEEELSRLIGVAS